MRQLYQVVHDGQPDFELIPGASVLAPAGAVPQSFVYAPGERISELAGLPGVHQVQQADLMPARFAIGVDRILTFSADHVDPALNGFKARVDHDGKHPDGVPNRPILRPGSALVHVDEVREPTVPFRLAAVVVSKEPDDLAFEPGPGDPVAMATMCASGFDPTLGSPPTPLEGALRIQRRAGPVVCLPTGNRGQGALSAWVEQDWVLAVGATDDAAGAKLARYSGRRDDGSGHDVLALGSSRLNGEYVGTSFAAPRAARCAGALWTLAANVVEHARRHMGRPPMGVPLAAIGIVDDARRGEGSPLQLPRYPLAGVAEDAVATACDELIAAGLTPEPRIRGGAVRTMLEQSAQDTGIAGGAGFVSDETTFDYVRNATAADIAAVLLAPGQVVPAEVTDRLSQIPIADPVMVETAVAVWFGALLLIHVHQEDGVVTLG